MAWPWFSVEPRSKTRSKAEGWPEKSGPAFSRGVRENSYHGSFPSSTRKRGGAPALPLTSQCVQPVGPFVSLGRVVGIRAMTAASAGWTV